VHVKLKDGLRLSLAVGLAAMYLIGAVHYPLHEHHGCSTDPHEQNIGHDHVASEAHHDGDCAFCLVSSAPVLAIVTPQTIHSESLTIHEGFDSEVILSAELDLSTPHRGPPAC
jgi:hypothetical protein